ncbi:terminase large subunit [Rhodomicrobium vannielii ATCC 17100]|nr:terminase large subunit [Rhodomicrobium vannielii ATCC 17100]
MIAFIEELPITSGSQHGQRMKLRPWQRQIVETIYGTNDQGCRPVRTALITVARKNGKTALAAALALAHLLGPEAEPRGQIYSAAADREQAALIFREMAAIIKAVPWMDIRTNVRTFTRDIEDLVNGSFYKALSSDAPTKHGLSASFVVYDELAQAPNRDLYDVLATSVAARAEPLVIVISTQSPDPNHVMSELVSYGRQVLDGVVSDPTFAATIYTAPLDADPWSEATWFAANPALGDFRSLEEMRTSAKQAQRIPAREATFRSLYLNQPVQTDDRFIALSDWKAAEGAIDAEALKGRPCWGGLDLGSTRDLTAFCLYFPDDGGAVLPFCWCPAENLDARERDHKIPYALWAKQGFVTPTKGRAVDKRAIALTLAELATTYDIRGIAFDRWQMAELERVLAEEGVKLPLIAYGQGYKDMSPAVAALEGAILDKRLKHSGHPVLTWCMSNVVIDTDPAGNRKITKERAKEQVDLAVALAMACGLHAREPGETPFVVHSDMISFG